MLIRTQNRRNLVDMTGMSFRVCKYANSDKYSVEAYNNAHHASYEILGIYSTSKAALKVLDMIAEYYSYEVFTVFEIPTDEEVSV